jgi:F-type H+-transporting ATPase subunit delta
MQRLGRVLRFAAADAPKTGVTNRMLLTLGSPRESIYLNKPVDSVTVPGLEGYFTLTHNHSLIVSMLKPGVITVRVDAQTVHEYFVSDGFCFFNHSSDDSGCSRAEISGVEVVPTSALDKDRAVQMIAELNAQPKETEWDKVRAQLGTNLLNQVVKFSASSNA